MTEGEYRVGIVFNPSQDDAVARIKRAAADLIDLIETIHEPDIPDTDDTLVSEPALRQIIEIHRLKYLAQTAVEEAAMWAVKAATKPLPQTDGETK